jgi:catechol 2,3-dioxygenase-like lactoylglutathione lyase family enzyme
MPISTGLNHVATGTPDLDRVVRFSKDAFEAEVVFEMAARDDHPRMAILDLGGGDVGEVQRLGGEWSLFFRDIDGMELEVCAKAE